MTSGKERVNQPPVVDAVGLAVFIAATVFSAEVAAVVGPYFAIVAAAALGASFSLIRRDVGTRPSAVWFFIRVCGAATLLTVGLAALIALVHPNLNERILLVPVSLGLGLLGDDYPEAGKWVVSKLSAFIDVLISLRSRGSGTHE